MVVATRDLLLSTADLAKVPGSGVGAPNQLELVVSRDWVDRPGPISMNDGSPKAFPDGTPREPTLDDLRARFGARGACYLGELVLWKACRAEVLGKRKWETAGGLTNSPSREVNTIGDMWHMVWVLPTHEDARRFHATMRELSAAADGEGYLDNLDSIPTDPAEVPGAEDLTLLRNRPARRPANAMELISRSGELMVGGGPPKHVHVFGAVFVVDRVVCKVYCAEAVMTPAARALTRETFVGVLRSAVVRTCRGLGLRELPSARPSAWRPPRAALAGRAGGAEARGFLTDVAGLEPALARSFLDTAAAMRDARPWEGVAEHGAAFGLGCAHVPGGREAVVLLLGVQGGEAVGLRTFPDAASFERHLLVRPRPALPAASLELTFFGPDDAELGERVQADILRLARPLGAAVSEARGDPQRRTFPVLFPCGEPARRLTPDDVALAEAAMAMSVAFFARAVRSRPVPPPPHAVPYEYAPCGAGTGVDDEPVPYESGRGHGGAVGGTTRVACRPAYPACAVRSAMRPAVSLPGAIGAMGVVRPASVRTVAQAVEYHREALGRMGPLLRRRVRVRGLTARAELNGRAVRVILFSEDSGRYTVRFLPADADGAGAAPPEPVAVRPECLQPEPEPMGVEPPPPPEEGPCRLDRPPSGPPGSAARVRNAWRAHTYGLANALWEAETAEAVAEAIALAQALLWDDPADAFRARDFLLDVLLETGRWEDALALMARYGSTGGGGSASRGARRGDADAAAADAAGADGTGGGAAPALGEEEDVWAWVAALLHMRISGPRSARARRAIGAAVRVSPHVYPLLARLEPLPDDARRTVQHGGAYSYGVVRLAGVGAHFSRGLALRYTVNHGRHWWAAGDDFVDALRELGAEAYAEFNGRVNTAVAQMQEQLLAPEGRAADGGGGGGGAAARADDGPRTELPKLCAACHATGVSLRACIKCKQVYYCGRDCQKRHWKAHKRRCAELATAASAAQ